MVAMVASLIPQENWYPKWCHDQAVCSENLINIDSLAEAQAAIEYDQAMSLNIIYTYKSIT